MLLQARGLRTGVVTSKQCFVQGSVIFVMLDDCFRTTYFMAFSQSKIKFEFSF